MKYFINRNIFKDGVTTEDSEYSSTNKLLWIFAPLGVAILIVAAIIAMTKSFVMGIPATIALGIAYIYILRKFVFDENQYKKLVANNAINKEIGIRNFNNVLNISDDGRIFFQTNEKGMATAYIVTFDYSSLTDSSDDANVNVISGAYVPFFKELWLAGFDFNMYDIKIKSELSFGTKILIEKARQLDSDEWFKTIIKLQNETISNLEQNGSAKYKIFFEIKNSNPDTITNFRDILESIISKTLTQQITIHNAHIISGNELKSFFKNYFLLENIKLNERNVKNISVEHLFNFISFGDYFGKEYYIDAFDPQFTNSDNSNFDLNKEQNNIKKEVNKIHKEQVKNQNNKIEKDNKKKVDMIAKKKYHIVSPNSDVDNNKKRQQELERKEEQMKMKQNQNQNKIKNSQKSNENSSFQDLLNKF